MAHIEEVTNGRCLLGESPLWDHNTGKVYWVDIPKGAIHEYNVKTSVFRTIKVAEPVSSIGLYSSEKFIGTVKNGFAFIGKEKGDIDFIQQPPDYNYFTRFNDGKCDPYGRFYAGTMSLQGKRGCGGLYSLDTDLVVSKQLDGISLSNGLCWSRDAELFYYIDTPTYEIVSLKYDRLNGALSDSQVVIRINEEDGAPDGMTIDDQGMLWICHWDKGRITRNDPSSGEKLLTILLPVTRPTSCAFGGNGLEDLYITTASFGLTSEELQNQPLAGALLVIKNCGYNGFNSFTFKNRLKNNGEQL